MFCFIAHIYNKVEYANKALISYFSPPILTIGDISDVFTFLLASHIIYFGTTNVHTEIQRISTFSRKTYMFLFNHKNKMSIFPKEYWLLVSLCTQHVHKPKLLG